MQATRQKVTQLKPYQENRSPPRVRERKTVVKSTKLVIPDPPPPKKVQKPAVKDNASVLDDYNRGIWLSPSKKEQVDVPLPSSPKTPPSSEEKKEYVKKQIKKRTAEISELKKIRLKEEEIKRERLKALRQKQLQLVQINLKRSKEKREAKQIQQEQMSPRSKHEEETEQEQMESQQMGDQDPTHLQESAMKEMASHGGPEKGEQDCKEKEHLGTQSSAEDNSKPAIEEAPVVLDAGAAISAKLKYRVQHLQKALQELKEAKSENTPRSVTFRSESHPAEEKVNYLQTAISSTRTEGSVKRKIVFPNLHEEQEESSSGKKVLVQLYPHQSIEEQEKWSLAERNVESPRNKIKFTPPEKSELNISGRKTVSDALKELRNKPKTEDSTENETETAFQLHNLKFQSKKSATPVSSDDGIAPSQAEPRNELWLKPSYAKPCSYNITTAVQNTINSMVKRRQPFWIQTNQDALKAPEQIIPVIDASKIRRSRKSVTHMLNERSRRSLAPSEDDTDAQSYISTTTDYNSSSDESSVKLRRKVIKSTESLLPNRIFPEESFQRHSAAYVRRPKKRPKSLHSVKPKTSEEIESLVMNRLKKEATNVTLRRRNEREPSPPGNTWNSHTVHNQDDLFPNTKYVNKSEIEQQTGESSSTSKYRIGEGVNVGERLRELFSGYERNLKKAEKSQYSETFPGMSLHPAALHFQFQSQLNLLDSVEESRHHLSEIESLLAQKAQVTSTEVKLAAGVKQPPSPSPPTFICDAETQTSEKKSEETLPQKAVQVKPTSKHDRVSASTQTLEPTEEPQPPVQKHIPSSVTVRENSIQTMQSVQHKPLAESSVQTLQSVRHRCLAESSVQALQSVEHKPLAERTVQTWQSVEHKPLAENSVQTLQSVEHKPLAESSVQTWQSIEHKPLAERSVQTWQSIEHKPLTENSVQTLQSVEHKPFAESSAQTWKSVEHKPLAVEKYTSSSTTRGNDNQLQVQHSNQMSVYSVSRVRNLCNMIEKQTDVVHHILQESKCFRNMIVADTADDPQQRRINLQSKINEKYDQQNAQFDEFIKRIREEDSKQWERLLSETSKQYLVLGSRTDEKQVQEKPQVQQLTGIEPPNVTASLQTLSNIRKDMLDLEKTVQDNVNDTATDISVPEFSDEVGSIAYSDVSYTNSLSSRQKSEFSQYLTNTIVGDAKEQLAKLKESLTNIDKLMQDEKENCKKRIELMNERFVLLKEKAHSDLKLLAIQMKKHKQGSREHSELKKKQELLYEKLLEAREENHREYNKLLKDTTARKAALRQQKMLIRDFLKNLLKNHTKRRSEEDNSSTPRDNKQSTSEPSVPATGVESSPLEISEHLDVADDQTTSEDHESIELDQLYAASDRATSEIKDLQARVKSLHSQLHRKRTEAEALTEQWKTHLKLKEQSLLKKIKACDAYISKTKCELLKNKSSSTDVALPSQNGETHMDSPPASVKFLSKVKIQEEKDSSSADVQSIPADSKLTQNRLIDEENIAEEGNEKQLTLENVHEISKESRISRSELYKMQEAALKTDFVTENKIENTRSLHDSSKHSLGTENIMQWLQNVSSSYTSEVTTPKESVPKLSQPENDSSSKDEIETTSFMQSYLDSASSVKTTTDKSYKLSGSSLRNIIGSIREALEISVKSSVKDHISDKSPSESAIPESIVENGSLARSIDEQIPAVNDVQNTSSIKSPKEEISVIKSASENIPRFTNIETASSVESASNVSVATSAVENGTSDKHITYLYFNNASLCASDASSVQSELEVHSNKSIAEDILSVPSSLEDGAKDVPLNEREVEHSSSAESVSQKTSSVKDAIETEGSSIENTADYSKSSVESLSTARNDVENIPSVEDHLVQNSLDKLDQNASYPENGDVLSEEKVVAEDSPLPNLNSTLSKSSINENAFFKKSEDISTKSKDSLKSSLHEDLFMEKELNDISTKSKDSLKSSLHEDLFMKKELNDISTKSKDSVKSSLQEDLSMDEELNISANSKDSVKSSHNVAAHEDLFMEKQLNDISTKSKESVKSTEKEFNDKDTGEAKTSEMLISESAFHDSTEPSVNDALDIDAHLINKLDTEDVTNTEHLNTNIEQPDQQKLVLQKVDKTADKFLQKIIDESVALHSKNRSKKKDNKIVLDKSEQEDVNLNDTIRRDVGNKLDAVEKITDSIFENILKDSCSNFLAKKLRKNAEDSEPSNLLAGPSVSSPERNSVDVRKRVHEILLETSPSSARENSKLQDFMRTTYDISPPEENSQPGSPYKVLLDGNRTSDTAGETEIEKVNLGAKLRGSREIEAVDNESFTQEWFDDDFGLNHTRREAEELRLQQLQIEQEIQQLEQAQEQQVPYFYIREIPNKPPPPYTPPGQTPRSPSSSPPSPVAAMPCISKEQSSHFIPSSAGEVSSIAATLIDHLYNIAQTNGNLDLAAPPAGFYDEDKGSGDSQLTETQILSKRIYKKLMFDLIKDLLNEIYNFNEKKNKCAVWEWPAFSKRRRKPPPRSKEMLQDIVCKQVLTLFGFAPKAIKEKFVIRWSRKKRDYVDEILMKESQEEESSWTNYDEDETFVKNEIAVGIFDSIIDDTVQVLKKIFNKKYDT